MAVRCAKGIYIREKQSNIACMRTDNPKAFWDERYNLGPGKKSENIPMEVLIDGNTIDKINEV